jgi:hypothetical protein
LQSSENIDASHNEDAQQIAVGWYRKRLSCKEIRQRVYKWDGEMPIAFFGPAALAGKTLDLSSASKSRVIS